MATNVSRGRKRDLLVGVQYNTSIVYCFKTSDDLASGISGVSDLNLTEQLGHETIGPALVSGGRIGIIGANAPKPPRVSKTDGTTGRSISTYCAYNKLSSAIAAGWNVAKAPRSRGLVSSRRRIKVYVELFGLFYCYPMSSEDLGTSIGAGGTLGSLFGIKTTTDLTSTAELRKVIFGSTKPKPGRATVKVQNADGTSRVFSSFYAPDRKDELLPYASSTTDAVLPVFGSNIVDIQL